MAFDGITAAAVAYELDLRLSGSRIEKIYQPNNDELVFIMHTPNGKCKLYMSSSGHHARIHISDQEFTNPQNPSAFCMLMRKHIQNGRVTGINQVGSERIIEIQIETADELGYSVTKKLVIEIMGKHSNITLVDTSTMKIVDSIKRVSIDQSRLRQLLPGLLYSYPPPQDKIPFREVTYDDTLKMNGKKILDCIGGLSPVMCDEILKDGYDKLYDNLSDMRNKIADGDFAPCMYFKEDDTPMEFSPFPISSYDAALTKKNFDTISEAIESYYEGRESSNRIKQQGHDLKKATEQKLKKLYLKKQKLSEELLKAENSEQLRLFGELLTANLHLCKTGDTSVDVINYYDGNTVSIPLDRRFSPSKNAQNYFKKYGKAKTAVKEKSIQIEENDKDISYLESVLVYIENAQGEDTIESIRNELIDEGYLRKKKNRQMPKKQKIKPYEYISSEGFRILAGRNNTENDMLTLKMAGKSDLWLHTKDIPGSHIIVFLEGKQADEKTIYEAASIAAYHSKARQSAQVPVDYVPVRYVKKPNGAKPGMVIFTNNRTVYVTPKVPEGK